MPRDKFKTIDEYIESFPQETKTVLQRIRETIKKAAPGTTEGISYAIPTFYLNGKYLIYFAGFAKHVSIYPAPRGADGFKEELSKYKGGKGTVQFPIDKPIPYDLIKRIVEFRIKETTANQIKTKKK